MMIPVFDAGSFMTNGPFDVELERRLQQAKREHERAMITIETLGHVVAHTGYVIYVQSNETAGTLAFGFTYDSCYTFQYGDLN